MYIFWTNIYSVLFTQWLTANCAYHFVEMFVTVLIRIT